MRLKIKVPRDGRWPAHYHGKTVEVEIPYVRLPDGQSWAVNGLEAKIVQKGLLEKLLGNERK